MSLYKLIFIRYVGVAGGAGGAGSRVTIKIYTLGLGPTPQLLLLNKLNCIVLLPTFKRKFKLVKVEKKHKPSPFIDAIKDTVVCE